MKRKLKDFVKSLPLFGNIAIFIFLHLNTIRQIWIDFILSFRNVRYYDNKGSTNYNDQWTARLGLGGYYQNIVKYIEPNEVSTNIRGDDEFMLSFIPKGSKVLEVGCGSGRLGYLLTKNNECQWVGLDISCIAVNEAKRKGLEAYVCNLNNINDPIFDTLRNRRWDYIISLWTIQLLDKSEGLIQLLGNMCNVQIHGTWNAGHWSSRLRFLFGRYPIYSYSPQKVGKHIYPYTYGYYSRHWTFDDFKQWASDLGFEATPIGVGYKFPTKTAELHKRIIFPSLLSGRVAWYMIKIR